MLVAGAAPAPSRARRRAARLGRGCPGVAARCGDQCLNAPRLNGAEIRAALRLASVLPALARDFQPASRVFRAGPRVYTTVTGQLSQRRNHAPAVAGTVAAHAPCITNVANYKTARTLARPLTPSARSLIKIDDSRCGRTLRRRQTRQSRHARHNNLLRAPTAAPAGPVLWKARPRPWTAPPATRRPVLLIKIKPARP